jgi:hypothetical protein
VPDEHLNLAISVWKLQSSQPTNGRNAGRAPNEKRHAGSMRTCFWKSGSRRPCHRRKRSRRLHAFQWNISGIELGPYPIDTSSCDIVCALPAYLSAKRQNFSSSQFSRSSVPNSSNRSNPERLKFDLFNLICQVLKGISWLEGFPTEGRTARRCATFGRVVCMSSVCFRSIPFPYSSIIICHK